MFTEDTSNDIEQRRLMVQLQLRPRGIDDENVLRAMEQVPRHLFIPAQRRHEAYQDSPVPIGQGQTISQPYIVALMTQSLQVESHHRVLEVGTGCGYQTAILSRLIQKVYTIELLQEIAQIGRENLTALGFNNIEYHIGNAQLGWPTTTTPSPIPFDRIIVTAGADVVPEKLLEQLAEGGKMVIPVGLTNGQKLILLEKRQGKIEEEFLCYCRFVKLKNTSE